MLLGNLPAAILTLCMRGLKLFLGLTDIRESSDPGGQCGFGQQASDDLQYSRFYGYVYSLGQDRYSGAAAMWDTTRGSVHGAWSGCCT